MAQYNTQYTAQCNTQYTAQYKTQYTAQYKSQYTDSIHGLTEEANSPFILDVIQDDSLIQAAAQQ